MTLRPAIFTIGILGTLGIIGDLPYAVADSPPGPPRSRSTPSTQITSPTSNAPTSAGTASNPTPEAPANQSKMELRFVAVELEGVKLWLGGGDIDVKEFRASKVITFRLLNRLEGDHGFAVDALKIKQIIKPGEEVSISVSLEDFEQSVSVYRYYCQLHPGHWGGTGVITGKDAPPRASSAPVGAPKVEPARGKDSSTARVPDESKTETETLKGKLLKIEKGFYVIESAPNKEVRVSAPLDAVTDENGKSLLGEWIEAQISSDLHVTGIKKSPAGYALEGELIKADGDVYIVANGPGKNVQLKLTKDTKVDGTYKIGDEIKAEFTPDGNITVISKKAAPSQEAQTVAPPEKPVRPVQEVLKFDRDWASALVRRDTRSLERAMADNVIATAWNIEVLNKPQYLAEIASGDFAFKSIEIDEAKVRVYGDAVLVTGRYTVKGRYKEQDISGQHRYTNLYVKQQGAWRLVSQNVHPQSQ